MYEQVLRSIVEITRQHWGFDKGGGGRATTPGLMPVEQQMAPRAGSAARQCEWRAT